MLQVSEILTKNKKRLSLNGWFHSTKKMSSKQNDKKLTLNKNICSDDIFELNNFFSPTYLDIENKLNIKKKFQMRRSMYVYLKLIIRVVNGAAKHVVANN